ncbi:MAG: hypothetical protein OXU79_04750 [Gemmatimonadota bacterium]|nr:hypothetical protein [Gemmatimonadota bacterium]
MTGLVDTVRGKVQNVCLVSGPLKKEGCSVSLKDAPPRRLIVDFDKPGSPLGVSMTRCDYLLIADDADDSGWVVPVELKKGRLDASEAVKQLRAGANAARKLVPKGSKVNFRPVVAAGGNKAERNKLKDKRNWVRFRDHAEYVRLLKCGDQLINAFKVTQI